MQQRHHKRIYNEMNTTKNGIIASSSTAILKR
jgi:hypothetical protein